MCFTEKCGSKLPSIIIGNFMSSVAELLPLLRIASANFSTGKPDLEIKRQGFGRPLHAGRRHHVRRDLDRGRVAHLADLDDLLAARFQNRARLPQRRLVTAHVINQLAFFRRGLASGKGRIEKARTAFLHDFSRGPHGVGRDRAVSHDDVVRAQFARNPLHHLEQRLIVRDKDLDEIAELRDLRGRSDKIGNGTRRAVPNEDMKSVFPQVIDHSLADDSEADYSNIFSCAN